ncbi:MAG: ABC transporter permease subunit [Trueperaceae bacterium]|nr:ABC transporter permease subunit [Trueperaceae bacterium]
MRLWMIFHVAGKEIRSTLRDRRAILSNLLVPLLLLPIVMLGLPLLIGGLVSQQQETASQIGIEGLDNLPDALRQRLEAQNIALQATDTPEQAVREDTYSAALSVPANVAERIGQGENVEITVYTKPGNLRSELDSGKIRSAVQSYRQEIVRERLEEAGLEPSILEPVTISTVNANTEAEQASGQLSWLIPFFIAIWTLSGGQMTAIDATAGEKERGTLEVLLVAPIRRSEVVVGKFVATLLFGLSAALMAIVGYILGGTILRSLFSDMMGDQASEFTQVMGGSLSVGPLSVVLLVVSTLLLAMLIAALLIGITSFARSFREAQTYLAPLSFLLILPAISLQFSELLDFGPLIYLVPVVNALLLMDDIVTGSAGALPVLLTWASLLAFAALLLDFAYRSFKREGVIFRT